MARDIIRRCLTVDAKKRMTINEFLSHPWLRGTEAMPAPLYSPAIIRETKGVVSLRDVFRVGVNFQRTAEQSPGTPIVQRGSTMRLGPVDQSGILGRYAARAHTRAHDVSVG